MRPVHAVRKRLINGRRSPEWRRVRNAHIRRSPACRVCGGTAQLQVHHKLPYHLHPELELDPLNLITLCEHPGRNCHLVFGHFHNWRAYNPLVEEYAHWYKHDSDRAHARL